MDLLYVIIILVSIIYISQTKFAKRIFSKKKCKYDPVIYMIIGFGIILGLYYVSKDIEGFQGTNQLYGKLMNDFGVIFPDGNRNSGGVQFYHHIVKNLQPTKREFLEYNKFYCGVSGSPIDPQRTDAFDYLVVDDLQGNKVYGKYWRCCFPCVCDVTKYAKVETHTAQLKDGPYIHHVLTIGDPCSDQSKIPPSVSSFTCSNQKTQNGIRTSSGRLIIAVLYDVVPYTNQNITNINDMCRDRNSTPPDQLQGGMGDIFVKLALINP